MLNSLFADESVMQAESEEILQKVVKRFYIVFKRKKFKVSAGKSKLMVFGRRE